MESLHGFDFFRLRFDEDGKLQDNQSFEELKHQAAGATDVIFLAHGFRNDENDATGLYDRFLETLRNHLNGGEFPSLRNRRFEVAGIYWPSKQFRETFDNSGSVQAVDDETAQKEAIRARLQEMKTEDASDAQKPKIDEAISLLDQVKDSKEAQDRFVQLVFSLLDNMEPDPTEGVDRVRATEGSELLDKLKAPIIVPTEESGDSEGGVMAVAPVVNEAGGTQGLGSFFGSIFGRIGQVLNLTTWYIMKSRAGIVGANGVAQAVRDLKTAAPNVRIHLVGHSLGGRLMAACAKSLSQAPKVQPDSLTLLEAAFSHYGFSPNNGKGQAGFFRSVIDQHVVQGPLLATYSAQDSVVGKVYAIASRLAGDSVQEIGDANDPFGGIGRNGAQKTAEAVVDRLHQAGTGYQFPAGKIVGLDGSGGLIKDHSDVTNANVTYAFACAVAAT